MGPHRYPATPGKRVHLAHLPGAHQGAHQALAAIGDRPVMLGIGEELPAGGEEATMQHLFDLAADNPRLTFGFTGLGWKKADEPTMRDLHRRMDDYYASVVEAGPKHGT